MTALSERHRQILEFLLFVDRLKSVERQIHLADGSRHENDAEHSWHMALFAMLLKDELTEDVNLLEVMEMVIVHDLVEVLAGDVGAFDDPKLWENREACEQAAAEELFGMLPDDLGTRLRSIWESFEAAETIEARFAKALDRLQPCALGVASNGRAWEESGAGRDRVVGFMDDARRFDPLVDAMFVELFHRADRNEIWSRT